MRIIRLTLAGCLLLPATIAPAQTLAPTAPVPTPPGPALSTPVEVQPLSGGPDFITPAGEPLRSPDKLSGAEHWFRAADTNGDGRLTAAEVRANAALFFPKLDTDGDGEIAPLEIERYETVIAPEIRVTGTFGGYTGTDSDGKPQEAPYPDRLGAGRFGYIDLPEPIIAMDTNLDRGVSRKEYDKAVDARFRLLDANHDGFVDRAELPKLNASDAKRGGRPKRPGRVPKPASE